MDIFIIHTIIDIDTRIMNNVEFNNVSNNLSVITLNVD